MNKSSKEKERMALVGFVMTLGILFASLMLAEFIAPKASANNSDLISIELQALSPAAGGQVLPIPERKPSEVAEQRQTIQLAMADQGFLQDVIDKTGYKQSSTSLTDKQERLYREIFFLQKSGKISEADEKISQIKNPVLMGYVLADRYLHPTAYRAAYSELKQWLDIYADLPMADKIYKLALNKKPASAKVPKQPIVQNKIGGNLGHVGKIAKNYESEIDRSEEEEEKVSVLSADIRRHLQQSQPTVALSALNSDYTMKFMDKVEYDRLRASIAASYMLEGRLDQALSLSQASLERSGSKAPLSAWVKGLVQWQKANYDSAAKAFEVAAGSEYASAWLASAASYWASRSHMRAGNVKQVSRWLEVSATYPRTFYGLIAIRALGHKAEFDWRMPNLNRNHIRLIESQSHGQRAAALIRCGMISQAENELRNISFKSAEMKEALIAYAHYYKLPSLQMQLANAYKNEKGGLYDAALYPESPWQPTTGYKVDKALIHAIIRQESRFHANAYNASGATGLMQLMPETAKHIAGSNTLYVEASLHNPESNLDMGQSYVHELLNHPAVGQDLLSLAMAYNAGPGNLSKWKKIHKEINDPLLFIEMIPFDETRNFVERVLANYWIYSLRYDQETPSLDDVASGRWTRYVPQDEQGQQIASAE